MFDGKTLEILKKAGWYPERKINVDLQIETLKKYGFDVFEKAIEFMEKFGELEFVEEEIINNQRMITKHNTYIINIMSIFDEINDHELIKKKYFNLSKYTSEKTIPIGVLSDGEMYLFITETGRIVTETVIEGENIEEGINSIITGTGAVKWKEKNRNFDSAHQRNFMDIMNRLKKGETIDVIRKD